MLTTPGVSLFRFPVWNRTLHGSWGICRSMTGGPIPWSGLAATMAWNREISWMPLVVILSTLDALLNTNVDVDETSPCENFCLFLWYSHQVILVAIRTHIVDTFYYPLFLHNIVWSYRWTEEIYHSCIPTSTYHSRGSRSGWLWHANGISIYDILYWGFQGIHSCRHLVHWDRVRRCRCVVEIRSSDLLRSRIWVDISSNLESSCSKRVSTYKIVRWTLCLSTKKDQTLRMLSTHEDWIYL